MTDLFFYGARHLGLLRSWHCSCPEYRLFCGSGRLYLDGLQHGIQRAEYNHRKRRSPSCSYRDCGGARWAHIVSSWMRNNDRKRSIAFRSVLRRLFWRGISIAYRDVLRKRQLLIPTMKPVASRQGVQKA